MVQAVLTGRSTVSCFNLAWFSSLSSQHFCVFGLHSAIYIPGYLKKFCLHPSLYLFVSWAWWHWPFTWLTNRPSIIWCCWSSHLTRKIVPKMTYNVSSGTLNPTIPYHTIFVHNLMCVLLCIHAEISMLICWLVDRWLVMQTRDVWLLPAVCCYRNIRPTVRIHSRQQ